MYVYDEMILQFLLNKDDLQAFRCGAKDSSVLSLCEWLACHALALGSFNRCFQGFPCDADAFHSRAEDATKLPQEIHLSHNELTTGSLEV